MRATVAYLLGLALASAAPVYAEGDGRQARAVLKAMDRAVLSAELAAKVEKLPVRAGDRFRKGDLLVGLDCDLYRAQASKVAAQHRAAGLKLENVRQLDNLGSVGGLEVSLAQAERSKTAAELQIARINTKRCQIKAPYDGRVAAVLVNRYENVSQQQELIEIVNDKQLEAEIVVPASWLSWLKSGQSLTLLLDDTGARIPAKVAALSPAIDTVSQTLVVRAQIEKGQGLMPGGSATAEFKPPHQDAVAATIGQTDSRHQE